MRISISQLPALFTRSPLIEITEEDHIENGLAPHHVLFTEPIPKPDPMNSAATDITDPWSRDIALFLNNIYPDQDVDYVLVADANTRITPYDHTVSGSSTNATEIWTQYVRDVTRAYIYLKRFVAAPTAPGTLHSTDKLTSSAIHTILQQLDKTTLDAAQLTRENIVLRATITRYEQENEELEEVNP
ncbi:hypothetical protein G6011_00735 [Alternaria panax]|uniref:Uncharacterized protein n=1 Tax=Alternaria panax TaxID=48097 RepID=A0AAD4IJF0_9PLEO|nr:hypothetical protein G6011_00735 [Alternaria panax]